VLVVKAVIPKITSLKLSRHYLDLFFECFDQKKKDPPVGYCFQLMLIEFSDS